MKECRYKKRLQLYLDGWTSGNATVEMEEHLRSCPECQAEMAELIEVNGLALEIIDHAPDRTYWDSFTSRVRNRIIARDSEPLISEKRPPRPPTFSLTSVLVIILLFIGATAAFLLRPVEKVRIIMPPTMGERTYPGSFPGFLPPPRYAGFGFPNYASRPSEETLKSGPTKPVARDKSSNLRANDLPQLEIRNLVSQFRIIPDEEQSEFGSPNEYALTIAPPATENPGGSYPAFRLKDSFVGQRLLAGIGMTNPSGSSYQDQLFGNGSGNIDGTSSNWGYLRNPSENASKSGEIDKYRIELELMQTK